MCRRGLVGRAGAGLGLGLGIGRAWASPTLAWLHCTHACMFAYSAFPSFCNFQLQPCEPIKEQNLNPPSAIWLDGTVLTLATGCCKNLEKRCTCAIACLLIGPTTYRKSLPALILRGLRHALNSKITRLYIILVVSWRHEDSLKPRLHGTFKPVQDPD